MTGPIKGHNVITLRYVGGPYVVPACGCGWIGPRCFEASGALDEAVDHRCDAHALAAASAPNPPPPTTSSG